VSNARDELQRELSMFSQGQPEVEQSIKELAEHWSVALADMRNIRVKIRLLAVPEFVVSSE
jgi:hypothetical protein